MSKITILHLSDLHLKSKEQAESLEASLCKDIELLQKPHYLTGMAGAQKIDNIDVIAVTGDLTFTGRENQFKYALEFLNNLKQKVLRGVSKERVVLIPGNHDVNWNQKHPVDKFTRYNYFIHNFYDDKSCHDFPLFDTNARRFYSLYPLTINGQDVLFIGLNSSIEYTRNKPIGSLPEDHLNEIEEELKNPKYEKYKRRIALVHHSCLRTLEDRDSIKNWSKVKDKVQGLNIEMILHGHLHRGDLHEWMEILNRNLLLIASTGTCRIGDGEDRKTDSFQYQIIRRDGNKSYFYRRRFDQFGTGKGKWVADSDEKGEWCYQITREGPMYRITSTNPKEWHQKFLFGNHNIPKEVMLSYHCSQDGPVEGPTFAHLINFIGKYGTAFSTYQSPGEKPGVGFKFDRKKVDDSYVDKCLQYQNIFCIDSGGYNCFTHIMLKNILKENISNLGVSFDWLPGMEAKFYNMGEKEILAKRKEGKLEEFQQIVVDDGYSYYPFPPKHESRDRGIIIRCPHPKGDGVIFIAAGIHKPATLAAIEIIGDPDQLSNFFRKAGKDVTKDIYFEAVFEVGVVSGKPMLKDMELCHFRVLESGPFNVSSLEMRSKTFLTLIKSDYSNSGDKKLNERGIKKIDLQTVHIDLTCNCPYHCPACIERELWKYREKATFNLSEILQILFDLKEMGVKDLRFYGGEPMDYPDFDKVVIAAAGMGFHIRLISNGYFLSDDKKFDAIVKIANHINCRFSIDAATQSTYEGFHGISDMEKDKQKDASIEIICERIKRLTDKNVPCDFSFLVGKDNYEELKDAFDKAKTIGARAFHIRTKTTLKATDLYDKFTKKELERINSQMSAIQKDKKNSQIKIICPFWFKDYVSGNIVPLERIRESKSYPCYSSLYRIVISPIDGGKIIFCAYRRTDKEFQIDLKLKNGGLRNFLMSHERFECFDKINPSVYCRNIICNRHQDNLEVYEAL